MIDEDFRPPRPPRPDRGIGLVGCGWVASMQLAAYRSAGYRVVAFAPDYTEASRQAIRALGAELVDYPLQRTGINPWQDMRSMLALRKALLKIRPDVVLAYTIKPVIWGTLAAWLARVPRRDVLIEGLGFVFTDSGSSVPLKRRLLRGVVSWLYRFALAHAHRVLMLNPDDIRDFATRGLVAPEKALNIGGIGVDLAEWPVVPLPDGPMTFCLAARLLREKGVYEYIEAARGIKARHPEARFLLLGSTDKNPGSLQAEEVAQWVREGVVEWPGHVPMRDWLARSDAGEFVVRGQSYTIAYFQSGARGQGRIQIEPSEIERLREAMRVRPQIQRQRRPPSRIQSYPGIRVPLGRPE